MFGILHQQINVQKIGHDTYTADSHHDWAIGPTLHGGCVAAVIHLAIVTHVQTEPSLAKLNQPDVLKLHYQYIRACQNVKNRVVITPVKLGAGISLLQAQLYQGDQIRIIAHATMTNFAQALGPSAPSDWRLLPAPKPTPDFTLVENGMAEPQWVPVYVDGELFPFTGRILVLNPRGGFPVNGICDGWNRFKGEERMDATYLAMMADFIPSMSDTLMRNEGVYDAHNNLRKMEEWADQHPGVPCILKPTLAEAMRATTFNATVAMDVEFKRRIPDEGLRWIFIRTETKMMEAGRMDLDITICNELMEVVCIVHQLILVAEAGKKFRSKKDAKSQL
jgi:acyl-coenzyme A thioesterase PaaI-like protein